MQSYAAKTDQQPVDVAALKAQCPRVALLTNIIPPYLVPVFSALSHQVASLRILLSAAMESDRPWLAEWRGLDVVVQKSWKLSIRQKYPQGFAADVERHLPYDTLRQLIDYRPDVVISAQLGFRTIQSVVYRCRFKSSRLVIWVDASEHTEKRVGPALTIARRRLLRYADAVLAIGTSGKRYLESLGVSPDRLVEVPYVVDLPSFSECRVPHNSIVLRRLLYVGQLIDRKGMLPFVSALIDWCARNRSKNCELWIVGDGPRRREFTQIPVPGNLSLKLFGNVPYKSVPEFYAQATITVLPSLADTWGLVVNESLAAGVPVLGSLYSQAIEMLIQEGKNGWTYWPDNPDDTQRALDRALNVTARDLDRMRVRARESVRHLTPEYAASRFARAIEKAKSAAER